MNNIQWHETLISELVTVDIIVVVVHVVHKKYVCNAIANRCQDEGLMYPLIQ